MNMYDFVIIAIEGTYLTVKSQHYVNPFKAVNSYLFSRPKPSANIMRVEILCGTLIFSLR